jgi:hypothetical protein
MAIWNICQPFGKSYGHLVHFVVIWHVFSRFGTMKNLATLFLISAY